MLRNVQLQVNQTIRFNVVLTGAALAETVNLVAEPALVQTDTSSLGQVVGTVQIENRPLNERNFVNYVTSRPGVQIDAERTLVSSP